MATLPSGLSFNTTTGEISGTFSNAGTLRFLMRVTDAQGNVAMLDRSITSVIGATPQPGARTLTLNGQALTLNGSELTLN